MKKVIILIVLMLGCVAFESKAQKIALKSNLLYDATTTMNLGLEFGLARKWTLDVPVNYNPWKPDNGRRLRHWGVQPEVRYWFCESFRRTFIGVHGHYADFNVGGFPDWSFISENMQNSRYQGYLRRYFDRTFVDIEKTLEYRSIGRSGICTYCIREISLCNVWY